MSSVTASVKTFVQEHFGSDEARNLEYHFAQVAPLPFEAGDPDQEGDIPYMSSYAGELRATGWIKPGDGAELSISLRLSSGQHQVVKVFND